jgi:SAM-dependent methyltransferase
MDPNNKTIFDRYGPISQAREEFLQDLLPELIDEYGLKTALDTGCGVGAFSKCLESMGLEVSAFDARPENVAGARGRYPHVKFHIFNVEDPEVLKLESSDLVLCLGLLYHLENPFRAIRNLHGLTNKIMVIESMITPHQMPGAMLVDEVHEIDQSLDQIAFVPSEAGLVKMLYKAGFASVYRPRKLPQHEHFRQSFGYRKRRTMLIATKFNLTSPAFLRLSEPIARVIWEKKWGHQATRLLHFFKKSFNTKVRMI